jgi:protein-tyrosine phosphatase
MPSILFVCTANQFRSPLAAACLLQAIEAERTVEAWIVESAGTWTKDGMFAAAITLQAARQIGVHGLHGHRTRQITRELLERYDLILVMERGHRESICAEFPSVRERVSLLSEIVDGMPYDIPDAGERAVRAEDIGCEISGLIQRGKQKILKRARLLARLRLI